VKIFLCNEVIRELDFARQCVFARETGYDGLEVAPSTLGKRPDRMTEREISALRKIADEEGVKVAGLHWLLAEQPGLSITADDEDTAARTLDFGKRLVALCAGLGGAYLVHGSPVQRQLQPGREEEGRRRGEAYFRAMAGEARAAGLRYVIEPLSRRDTGYVNTVDEALGIIGEIGSGALATMIDCYAAASNGEDIPALLEHYVPLGVVHHLHFNDVNRRGPGEGETDFGAVVDTLRRLGYSGTAAVEPFLYLPDGSSCAARAIGYLRGLMERAN
jgi:sugar phosphate isomerase/epimerase